MLDYFKLINYIKHEPMLWDSSDLNYRDVIRKEKAWKKISDAFSESVSRTKRIWKYLREKYRREKNRIDDDVGGQHRWNFYNSLTFLDSCYKTRGQYENRKSVFLRVRSLTSLKQSSNDNNKQPTVIDSEELFYNEQQTNNVGNYPVELPSDQYNELSMPTPITVKIERNSSVDDDEDYNNRTERTKINRTSKSYITDELNQSKPYQAFTEFVRETLSTMDTAKANALEKELLQVIIKHKYN